MRPVFRFLSMQRHVKTFTKLDILFVPHNLNTSRHMHFVSSALRISSIYSRDSESPEDLCKSGEINEGRISRSANRQSSWATGEQTDEE